MGVTTSEGSVCGYLMPCTCGRHHDIGRIWVISKEMGGRDTGRIQDRYNSKNTKANNTLTPNYPLPNNASILRIHKKINPLVMSEPSGTSDSPKRIT